MYLVGLTGGIASGKSTVAKRWVELGGIEIDADQLAREAVAKNSIGLNMVVETFGPAVLSNGELDRAKLADIIFNDAKKRKQLEDILHPIIRKLANERFAELRDEDIAIYNVPLLVEAKVDLPFDKVVTVEAPREKQIKRLINSRSMSVTEANRRIDAQATPTERANMADEILNSNQSIDHLLIDATALWRKIENEAAHGSH